VETITVEQIQLQPTVALIQQQQPVTTTTQIEEKTEEQVSDIDFAMGLCVWCAVN